MKNMLLWFLVLFFPALVPAADTPKGPPPARVVMAPVQEKIVAENTPIVGTLYFDRVSRLSTDVSGLVRAISFRLGDRVKKGAVLVRLNTDFIKKEIELAQTRIEQMDVQIEKVEKDLKRYETLYLEEAASEKAYDDLRFTRRELQEQRNTLVKQLEIERLKKTKSVILSPFDAIVLEKYSEVGNWVSPGVVFCRLGALDDLCAKVSVAEELVNYAHKGDKIRVTLNAFGKSMEGTVAGFLPVADIKTKNIYLKVKLPRIPRAAENMSATVRVATSVPKKFKLVPRDAVVNLRGQDFVYTTKNGRAAPLPVRVVAFVGEMAAVESPQVSDNMSVVVDGAERLRPDQPVQIIKGN
ncbi:MAG: efflux RND transporter periplasmic adaptor subunit [Deltaproteobacteria bacterium]|nr:efflux RND transporter periplasmic adaptor subunit [Deltaproteobacteria bacterium]